MCALLLTDSDETKKKMLEHESDYKSRNWITPALKEELELLFPTAQFAQRKFRNVVVSSLRSLSYEDVGPLLLRGPT